MSDSICRSYWKYGRSLWQEDIDQFLRAALAFGRWPIRSRFQGLASSGPIAGFILEGETERDDGEDAYLVPVISGGSVIDLCAFGIDRDRFRHTVRHCGCARSGRDLCSLQRAGAAANLAHSRRLAAGWAHGNCPAEGRCDRIG